MSLPKHKFIMWLAMLGRLRTKDFLWRIGVIEDQDCLLCSREYEHVQHLFFDCSYSKACLECIKQRIGWKCKASKLDKLARWILKAKQSSAKRRILCVVLTSLVYHIWRVRNDALWNAKIWLVSNTVQKIVRDCQMRLSLVMPKKVYKREEK